MANEIDIRSIRDTLKLSQADFAAKLGVDQSTVSLWEKRGLPKYAISRAALESRIASLLKEQAA